MLAGRGFGKSRLGAETVRMWAESGEYERIAIVGPTAADVRDVMIHGESGLLSVCPPWFRPEHEPSKRRLVFPNGVVVHTYSAEKPDRLRGPQHHAAWCDEVAAWRYPEAWDNLMMGLRLGDKPRVVATTTPRPTKLIRDLVSDEGVHVTRGSTYENRANLSPQFFREVVSRYEGTRLGRQELYAELLLDVPGALWTRELLDRTRVQHAPPREAQVRVVIGVDPAVTSAEGSNETGIVAVCKEAASGHGYVLGDHSMRGSPDSWARKVVMLYREYEADCVVAEVNQGGDLVEQVIRQVDPTVPVRKVRAARGKYARAEPIAALYEQGRVHHVGVFPQLEDQICTWTPDSRDGSPDRMDALVWALHDLDVAKRHESIEDAELGPMLQTMEDSPWA